MVNVGPGITAVGAAAHPIHLETDPDVLAIGGVNGDAGDPGNAHRRAGFGYLHRPLFPGLAAVGGAEDGCRIGGAGAGIHYLRVGGVYRYRPNAVVAKRRVHQGPVHSGVIAAVKTFVGAAKEVFGAVGVAYHRPDQGIGVETLIDADPLPAIAAVAAPDNALAYRAYQDGHLVCHSNASFFVWCG